MPKRYPTSVIAAHRSFGPLICTHSLLCCRGGVLPLCGNQGGSRRHHHWWTMPVCGSDDGHLYLKISQVERKMMKKNKHTSGQETSTTDVSWDSYLGSRRMSRAPTLLHYSVLEMQSRLGLYQHRGNVSKALLVVDNTRRNAFCAPVVVDVGGVVTEVRNGVRAGARNFFLRKLVQSPKLSCDLVDFLFS